MNKKIDIKLLEEVRNIYIEELLTSVNDIFTEDVIVTISNMFAFNFLNKTIDDNKKLAFLISEKIRIRYKNQSDEKSFSFSLSVYANIIYDLYPNDNQDSDYLYLTEMQEKNFVYVIANIFDEDILERDLAEIVKLILRNSKICNIMDYVKNNKKYLTNLYKLYKHNFKKILLILESEMLKKQDKINSKISPTDELGFKEIENINEKISDISKKYLYSKETGTAINMEKLNSEIFKNISLKSEKYEKNPNLSDKIKNSHLDKIKKNINKFSENSL